VNIFKIKIGNSYIKSHLLILTSLLCFLFGCLLLFTVVAAGDGTWFFYAQSFLKGQRLYSDLHLVQQPVFILVNALGISIFGSSFYGQKVIFLIVLGFYVTFIYLLVAKSKQSQLFKAILFLFVFFISIHFEAYRFDDYHVFTNTLVLMNLYFLINYIENDNGNSKEIYIYLSGVVLALCILTRVTDGFMLIISTYLLYLYRWKPTLLRDFFINFSSMILVLCAIFIMINEDVSTWLSSTIIDAAGSKGGSSLFFAPINLIKNSFEYLYYPSKWKVYLVILTNIFVSLVFSRKFLNGSLIVKLVGLIFVVILNLVLFFVSLSKGLDIIVLLTALSVVVLFSFCTLRMIQYAFYKRFSSVAYNIPYKELILIVPVLLFISGSLSSGGYHFGLYFPFALLILCFLNIVNLKEHVTFSISVFLFFVAMLGLAYKTLNPYSWHSYRTPPLISDNRMFVESKSLGQLLIGSEVYKFIAPVCKFTEARDASLLSIPFPFANYFCGVDVWQGYVQTFFDTTPSSKVNLLISELSQKPPNFIFYQQQLDNLRNHEVVFNHGKPLPQRELDSFILNKIKRNQWKVVYTSDFGSGNSWMLIDTTVN